jgi:hypothetical protein
MTAGSVCAADLISAQLDKKKLRQAHAPAGASSFRRDPFSGSSPPLLLPIPRPCGSPQLVEPLPYPPLPNCPTARIFRRHIAFVPGPAWALGRTPQPPRDA